MITEQNKNFINLDKGKTKGEQNKDERIAVEGVI